MAIETPAVPSGDYVSPGLDLVLPDVGFPDMIVGDMSVNDWPYLRRDIHHNWYVDRYSPTVGFVSRDEAAILYNTAKRFAGRPCLEIGCWRGWSTAHIALGCGALDVIDPILADDAHLAAVRAALARAGALDRVRFHPRPSPEEVHALFERTRRRWAFAFIDGDHEGDGPLNDAEAVARYAAADALVLFHDLLSPDVARGLGFFRDAGWRTMIYQTVQIMGVAWRGAVEPVAHIPDPAQRWWSPLHLAAYPVSGEPPAERITRVAAVIDQVLAAAGGAGQSSRSAGMPAATLRATEARPNGEADALDALFARLDRLLQCHRALAQSAAAVRYDELHRTYLKTAAQLAELRRHSGIRPFSRQDCDFVRWASGLRVLTGLLRRRLRLGPDAVIALVADQIRALRADGIPAAFADWFGRTRFLLGLLRRRLLGGWAGAEAALYRELIGAVRACDGEPEDWAARCERANSLLQAVESAKIADERALSEAHLEIARLQAQLAGRLPGAALPVEGGRFSTAYLRSEPWREAGIPAPVERCVSMLTADEKQFLLWAARVYCVGRGAIVDAGCFCGGSTVALAAGLDAAASDPSTLIDTYDRFEADDFMRIYYFERLNLKPDGDRFRNIFDANTAEFRGRVRLHDGDITAETWLGTPIELLFLDICKAWLLNDHCTQQFFPHLIPGHSLVVQQDFFHHREYWVILIMELLDEYFEYIGFVRWNTAVFRCVKALSRERIPDRLRDLGLPELERLLRRSIARHDVPYCVAMLNCALLGLYIDFGEVGKAAALRQQILARYADLPMIAAAVAEFPAG